MSKRVFLAMAVISVILVKAMCSSIQEFAGEGDRLFDFFLNRGFVQIIILFVFTLSASLLIWRSIFYVRSRHQLSAAQKDKEGWEAHGGMIPEVKAIVNKYAIVIIHHPNINLWTCLQSN